MKRIIDLKHHADISDFSGTVDRVTDAVEHQIQKGSSDRSELSSAIAKALEEIVIDIVKTGNGVPVSPNEPLILFRGRDRLATALLGQYRTLCELDGCNDFQLGQVDELINKFKQYAHQHPAMMKQPGVTRGK